MATVNDLPEATTLGQTYTLNDGNVLIAVWDSDPLTNPNARLIWDNEVQQIGRDQIDFIDGANEQATRLLALTATNQMTTVAQSTQTGSGISEADALGLIDASVAADDSGLNSVSTGLIEIDLVNRLPRGVVIASILTERTVTNPTAGTDYLVYDASALFGSGFGTVSVIRGITNTLEFFILGTDASVVPYLIHTF